MKNDARALSAALDGEDVPGWGGTPPDDDLLQLATEVQSAFAGWGLPRPAREGIWLRAMSMVEHPTGSRRRSPSPPSSGLVTISQRRPTRPGRLISALIGGTAVVAVAAIGVTVVHQRRAHGVNVAQQRRAHGATA